MDENITRFALIGGRINKDYYNMKEEMAIKPVAEESYTSQYSFSQMKKKTRRKAKEMKKLHLIFDRLVFDYDSKENPDLAVDEAKERKKWFNNHFPDLYTETWFSGNKGAHL